MNNEKEQITIKMLYPAMSDVELEGAERNIDNYLEVVYRIFKRKEVELKEF